MMLYVQLFLIILVVTPLAQPRSFGSSPRYRYRYQRQNQHNYQPAVRIYRYIPHARQAVMDETMDTETIDGVLSQNQMLENAIMAQMRDMEEEQPMNRQQEVELPVYMNRREEEERNGQANGPVELEMIMQGPAQSELMQNEMMLHNSVMPQEMPSEEEYMQPEAYMQPNVITEEEFEHEVLKTQTENDKAELIAAVELVKEDLVVPSTEYDASFNIAIIEDIMVRMAEMLDRMRELRDRQKSATERRHMIQQPIPEPILQPIDVPVIEIPATNEYNTLPQGKMDRSIEESMEDLASLNEIVEPEQKTYNRDIKFKYSGACTRLGMFLPLADPCTFAQCTFGPESRMAEGEVPIVPVKMRCARGMAVHGKYRGGMEPPCTIDAVQCGIPELRT